MNQLNRIEDRTVAGKSHGARILLVDDDKGLLRLLTMRLESAGYTVETATDGVEAISKMRITHPDLVISDLRMDQMNGMELFRKLQKIDPCIPFILITAHGSIPDAVSATQEGVFSFIPKPIDKSALLEAIKNALSCAGTARSPQKSEQSNWRDAIVSRSTVMRELLNQVGLVARSESSTLILGESGTGKELIAKAIHQASSRADGPFVALNCGAVPEHLLESELFGHVQGAFTGAMRNHQGLFQAACGGTLFLDEIGDMPMSLQVKLLRVLQEKFIRPLGSTRDVKIDVRIVSATHRDLTEGIKEKKFREDLFYRLNVVSLKLPPLRDRPEDILPLAQHFLQNLIEEQKCVARTFSPGAIDLLVAASWPGNVRQLYNIVEHMAALSTAPIIPASLVENAMESHSHLDRMPSFSEARKDFEREYLIRLMRLTGGNVSQAARKAQRNRTDFYKLLGRHNIEPGLFKKRAQNKTLQAASPES